MKKNPKNKRREAECAAEWYAHEIMNCVETRKAVKTQWQKIDFFGSDVVGKRANGAHTYLQVTAGGNSAVTGRRRKLEKIPWHVTDTVQLLQLVQTDNPGKGSRKLWFFRVHEYEYGEWLTNEEAISVPREWFKKWKEERLK